MASGSPVVTSAKRHLPNPLAAARYFAAADTSVGFTLQGLRRIGQGHQNNLPSRYLHGEALRREIHEGPNVAKQWNGATDFVFFARRQQSS
jgi:TnpA family transposase